MLLLAPTGVSAINISGTTIHTGLSIPTTNVDYSVTLLPDTKKTDLRYQLSELKMIIIDQVSLVSNRTFLYIHQRLQQIFDTPDRILFGGKCIVAVGDFYQLLPIQDLPIFADYRNDLSNLCHPWREFAMIDLTEMMRQKGDKIFHELLNRIRVGEYLKKVAFQNYSTN